MARPELSSDAEFVDDSTFTLNSCPFSEKASQIPLGRYELPCRAGEAHLYRLNHPLAAALVAQARHRELPSSEIELDYQSHEGEVSRLKPLVGRTGVLVVSLFAVESLDQTEDHLICVATSDAGEVVDHEVAARLLTLPGRVCQETTLSPSLLNRVRDLTQDRQTTIRQKFAERNARVIEAETEKFEGWADDLKGLEREIKDIDRQIKGARRAAVAALSLDAKLAGQKQIKTLETQRNQKRRSLFDAQGENERQRDGVIAAIEAKLTQAISSKRNLGEVESAMSSAIEPQPQDSSEIVDCNWR